MRQWREEISGVRQDSEPVELNKMSKSTFIDAPVFLVGSQRSGTTLLRLMLHHHPRIAFENESEFITPQISDSGTYPGITNYHEWLRNHRAFELSGLVINESFDFVSLVNDFLAQQRLRGNKDIVGTTVHNQFWKLKWIWPNAKYIYLYRDGRDVASSIMRLGWAGNVYVAADRWLRAEKEWNELRPSLDRNHAIEVRYEDLITDSKSQLERICTFLGVEYSDRMFDYSSRSTYSAPDASLIYQWKSGMRKLDVQRLEEKLGDRLLSRGYELSGHPRISIPWAAKKYLYFQSRVNAYLYRIHRYGTTLTLQETLARRLGLKRVHKNAISRINRIINANLK